MELVLFVEVSSNIWSKTFSKENCAANPFFLELATLARTREGFVKFIGMIKSEVGAAEISGSNDTDVGVVVVGYY